MISEQDPCSLHQVSVQDLQKRSPGKISVRDLLARSLNKISIRGLLARSLYSSKRSLGKISLHDRYKLSKEALLARFKKRPLGTISATDLCAMSLYKISKRGVLARSPVLYKISIRGLLERLLKRSLYKISPQISARDLKVRSLHKLCIKDLWARPLLSSPGFCTRSPKEVSWQDLCKRPLGKIPEQDLHKRSLGKISVQAPYKRSLL